jgi:hypothetical protein
MIMHFTGMDAAEGPQQNGFVEGFAGRLRDGYLIERLFPSRVAARRIIEA